MSDVTKNENFNDRGPTEVPMIMYIDSICNTDSKTANVVRNWINWEYNEKEKLPVDQKSFTNLNFPTIYPEVPKQKDSYNCGAFVCKFIEILYQKELNLGTSDINNNCKIITNYLSFTTEELKSIRRNLQQFFDDELQLIDVSKD